MLLQVRRLVCLCMVELYAVGDSLPMYACVGDLQVRPVCSDAYNLSGKTDAG